MVAPGVLLIGDAAHVMSPVGGVGINYAIQDAVEAANLLGGPLKEGRLRVSDLAAVQRRREWPTKVIQRFQGVMQRQIAAPALQGDRPFRPPWWLRGRAVVAVPARRAGTADRVRGAAGSGPGVEDAGTRFQAERQALSARMSFKVLFGRATWTAESS